MSQGLRDMLANRRFAIPLIVLLGFCFIGLLLIGVILIWKPGAQPVEEPVAQITATTAATATDRQLGGGRVNSRRGWYPSEFRSWRWHSRKYRSRAGDG
jgi:hypothetical protein